jgi:hypothetical protein
VAAFGERVRKWDERVEVPVAADAAEEDPNPFQSPIIADFAEAQAVLGGHAAGRPDWSHGNGPVWPTIFRS